MTSREPTKSSAADAALASDQVSQSISWTPETIPPAMRAFLFEARSNLLVCPTDTFLLVNYYGRYISFPVKEAIEDIEKMLGRPVR